MGNQLESESSKRRRLLETGYRVGPLLWLAIEIDRLKLVRLNNLKVDLFPSLVIPKMN
jgi:hypothetical protein